VRLLTRLLSVVAVAGVASFAWSAADRPAFEDTTARAAAEAGISADPSRCPLGAGEIARRPTWLLEACRDGGLDWIVAADRYGPVAEMVYRDHGRDEAFQRVFTRLGHPVIPVIAHVAENGSIVHTVSGTIAGTLSRVWEEATLSLDIADLTPFELGTLAIHDLDARGHEMMVEYEIVEGTARRRPLTSALLGTKSLLFGGVTDLERVIVRGERPPTLGEVGWAALDGALVAGSVGAAAKIARGVKAPAASLATVRAAGTGAARALVTVGKAAGVAGVIVIPYLAVTRPGLLLDAAAYLATEAGLPGWTGVFLAVMVAGYAVLLVGRFVFWPAFALARIGGGAILATAKAIRAGSRLTNAGRDRIASTP
jgi:hypothetical protein